MISLILAFVICFNAFASEIKMGVIDLQLALESVNEGKKAKEKIEKEFGEKQKLFKAKEEEVKKMYEDFQKKSLMYSEKVRGEKQAEIQKKYMEVSQLANQYQDEYQKKIMEIREPMIKSINSVIVSVSKKIKLDFVYAKQSAILYANDPVDITNDVIKKYNEIHK